MKYEDMEAKDYISKVMEFVLLGFSDLPNLQGLFFGVFSQIIYINLHIILHIIYITYILCVNINLHHYIYWK